jgi:hypothetical protein
LLDFAPVTLAGATDCDKKIVYTFAIVASLRTSDKKLALFAAVATWTCAQDATKGRTRVEIIRVNHRKI